MRDAVVFEFWIGKKRKRRGGVFIGRGIELLAWEWNHIAWMSGKLVG